MKSTMVKIKRRDKPDSVEEEPGYICMQVGWGMLLAAIRRKQGAGLGHI